MALKKKIKERILDNNLAAFKTEKRRNAKISGWGVLFFFFTFIFLCIYVGSASKGGEVQASVSTLSADGSN